MSAEGHQREVFIEKRTRALTMMLLTRQEGLQIEEVKEDIGLDYIVRFHSEGKVGLREFGIVMSGTRAAETKESADKILRRSLRQMKRYGPCLRPVCLFLFSMEKDEGWYVWVAEPIETEDGEPLLRSYYESDCQQLDNKALKAILERVDSWYDGVFQRLIVNGPGQNKTDRKQATP